MSIAEDRLESAKWASRVLEQPDSWAILDTETTGLHGDDEIVQIALISPDERVLLNSLVKPTCKISPEASRIHGIYDHHLVDARPFDLVFLDLLKALGRRKLCIYNVEFDVRMIQQSLRTYDICLSIPTGFWINGSVMMCAMLQYSQWVGEWNDYYCSYRWQRLPGGDHSALGDCLATLKVIKRMAASLNEVVNDAPTECVGVAEMPPLVCESEEYEDIPF